MLRSSTKHCVSITESSAVVSLSKRILEQENPSPFPGVKLVVAQREKWKLERSAANQASLSLFHSTVFFSSFALRYN